ncbi:hypothetical protein B6U99_02005 [Candidatus Geothermarchaeota archaeon ex4572_27]|nr:MAG: hypothetical protein B6U99_02005 [Candidatus Geothermarchaeota archaeon ex4572_27]
MAGEVARFCSGRWVAVHTAGDMTFVRYGRGGRPLVVERPEDIRRVFAELSPRVPRAFYGSANVYRRLASREDTEDPENIARTTPTWDVDTDTGAVEAALEAAGVIVDELERLGVSRSVYLKWSGRGVHVHIHENAFSSELLGRHNPLDIAYSVVEFVLRRVEARLREVASRWARRCRLKVENEMDIKRVFTAPLSLHRELDLAAVCLRPEDIDSFEIAWADPERPRHYRGWATRFLEGEADELALAALREVGGYFNRVGGVRTVVGCGDLGGGERLRGRIGRFQVMALLQAARYYILTGDLDKAKSFGLNRAIFYAWAKYYGRERGGTGRRRGSYGGIGRPVSSKKTFRLGDEVTFVSDEGWFVIGDREQRPEDYDRVVASKINAVMPYEEAWRIALDYVGRFSRRVLLSQQEFYRKVYEPVRDTFPSVGRYRTLL